MAAGIRVDLEATSLGGGAGQKSADANGDHLGAGGNLRGDAAKSHRDRGYLRLLDRGGNRLQIAVGELLGVGADDAREPRADLAERRAAIVREATGALLAGEGAPQEVRVGGYGV